MLGIFNLTRPISPRNLLFYILASGRGMRTLAYTESKPFLDYTIGRHSAYSHPSHREG